jgi:AcrR family transcriptional regulator
LTARLIAALRGAARPRPDDRVQAVLLIGSVMSFQSGASVSRRLLGWDRVGPAQQRLIVDALRRQIAHLAAAQ